MAKITLIPGVWANVGSIALTGAGALTGANAAQLWLQVVGWVGAGFSILLLLWGVNINEKHIWQRWWRTPENETHRTPRRSIAAPLHYTNSATASFPRYDDEHRGPAVTDAYQLSECWIDLAEHSGTWPAPENLPPLMIEFAEKIPENQRQDWLRRLAASEEVDRLISNAMRSGDLPIWVAPIGEPERLVAPGAMLEIDHATIVSGCYRPPNDRGWLSGRPLFVKRDDWTQFVDGVQRSKRRAA